MEPQPQSWNSSHRSSLVETVRSRGVSMLEGVDRETLSMLVDLQMAREQQQQQRARADFLLPNVSTVPVSEELVSPGPNSSDAPPTPYTPTDSEQHTPRPRSAVRPRRKCVTYSILIFFHSKPMAFILLITGIRVDVSYFRE